MNTVFGHLALQFSTHPENLATEALTFILRSSTAASKGFRDFLISAGIDSPEEVRYETQQVGVEQSIPDLKCIDNQGRPRVIVENKFWAGLTDNQPLTYFEELKENVGGVVLFVVPTARLQLVWDEVFRICESGGKTLEQLTSPPTIKVASIGGMRQVAITSWKSLLGALSAATISASDSRAQNDVAQLQGLCDEMDAQAFLPLRLDELTNTELARRIMNFSDLPFEVVDLAQRKGLCHRSGTKEQESRYCPGGTYVKFGSVTAWVGFDAQLWRTFGASPLWITFASPMPVSGIREKLARYRMEIPPRCFDCKGKIAIPITLKVGLEKDKLVQDGVEQIRELSEELGIERTACATT